MGWQRYDLGFRLLSPLHIGYRKVGNLMQTRRYVTGKVIWAALTARLTRDAGNGAQGKCYVETGKSVNEHFRFGYLFPAIPRGQDSMITSVGELEIHYPWKDPLFDYRFLDCYASTALNYDQQTAAEGQLREVEYIRPWTRSFTGKPASLPVYLVGYVYFRDPPDAAVERWRDAITRLELGGERGYGWGRVKPAVLTDKGATDEPSQNRAAGEPVTAHVIAESADISGTVEPLVGWERNNEHDRKSNWRLSNAKICYAPGAIVKNESSFKIVEYGLWEAISP